jgi:hypothetical protein
MIKVPSTYSDEMGNELGVRVEVRDEYAIKCIEQEQ